VKEADRFHGTCKLEEINEITASNLSYCEGRNPEDHGLRIAWA
jgi:hypothetical protein